MYAHGTNDLVPIAVLPLARMKCHGPPLFAATVSSAVMAPDAISDMKTTHGRQVMVNKGVSLRTFIGDSSIKGAPTKRHKSASES